jgi:hypothetical protein
MSSHGTTTQNTVIFTAVRTSNLKQNEMVWTHFFKNEWRENFRSFGHESERKTSMRDTEIKMGTAG